MNIIELQTGPLGANCYIVSKNGIDAAVIDAGGADEELLTCISENGFKVRAILLTHGHFDHIGGAAKLRELTGADIYIHEYDAELTSSRQKSLASWIPEEYFSPFEADRKFFAGDVIKVCDMEFRVIHCPGHTRGSSCLVIEDKMFCGDAVFKGSVGRSDVYGSDPVIQRAALLELAQLDGDYEMFCGHGEKTTLSYERRTNPFFK